MLRRLHRHRRKIDPRRSTDADPFELLEVDPTRIETSILETAPRRPQWGRVQGGDWDRRGEPFADRWVPRAIRARIDGARWHDTPLVDAFRAQLERFGTAWGYDSMEGFETRCGEIDRLVESIETRGYRRQSALAAAGDPTAVPILGEIHVDIARDGELLWRSYGQHRLAIARTLGIETVPVFVHRRHRGWEWTRDAVRDGRLSLDHPDLS